MYAVELRCVFKHAPRGVNMQQWMAQWPENVIFLFISQMGCAEATGDCRPLQISWKVRVFQLYGLYNDSVILDPNQAMTAGWLEGGKVLSFGIPDCTKGTINLSRRLREKI